VVKLVFAAAIVVVGRGESPLLLDTNLLAGSEAGIS